MSHTYLLALYEHIAGRREQVLGELAAAADCRGRCRARGRLEALEELEAFLHDHLDIKLPRRIRRRVQAEATAGQRPPSERKVMR